MGCRPSKQATSKVRAVEYKDGPACLCSPRKARKNHKCNSGSNSNSRNSGFTAKDSNKRSFSSSHRPRSSKSTDVDFPAFSTTTAVYRTSASKTSKITLRLSCDGSTLEIEQWDYDLEKVRGEIELKPRPWNSAPNLTKIKEGKSRVLRDSYLTMKHSKSGWSPGVTSATSDSRRRLICVPIQINTPDECISNHNFSAISPCLINCRDKGNTCPALESSTFTAKTFGKTSLDKSQTSSTFSSTDDRRPLLLDILKESHKKATIEGNINEAASPTLVEVDNTSKTLASNSLDNMFDQLENSLELVRQGTYDNSLSGCPHSLGVHEVDSHGVFDNCPSYLTQACANSAQTLGQGEYLEQIPVNVITSLLTRDGAVSAQPQTNQCLTAHCPNIDFLQDQRRVTNIGTGSSHILHNKGSVENIRHLTSQRLESNNYQSLTQGGRIHTAQRGTSRLGVSETLCRRGESSCGQVFTKVHDNSPHHSAIAIDSHPVLALYKQPSDENASYFLSTVDRSSVSLITSERESLCLSDTRHMIPIQGGDSADLKCAINHRENDVTTRTCQVLNLKDKITPVIDKITPVIDKITPVIDKITHVIDKNIPVSSSHEGSVWIKTEKPDNRDAVFHLAQVLPNRCRQSESIARLPPEPAIRCHTTVPTLLDVQGDDTSLPQIKQQDAGEQLSSSYRHVGSILSLDNAQVMLPATRNQIMNAHYARDEVTKYRGGGDTECVMEWAKLSNENIKSNQHSSRGITTPTCCHGGFHDKTIMSQQIDDNHWIVVNMAVDSDENNDSLCDSSLAAHSPDETETCQWKMWDSFVKNENDRCSQDAGYLIGLLCPDRDHLMSSLSSSSRFSFDFEYSECSSTSGASDNEASPLCYSLLGQPDRHVVSEEQGPDFQLDNTNMDHELTSMKIVRENIISQNLAIMEPALANNGKNVHNYLHSTDKKIMGVCCQVSGTCQMATSENRQDTGASSSNELSPYRVDTNTIRQTSRDTNTIRQTSRDTNTIRQTSRDNHIHFTESSSDRGLVNTGDVTILDGLSVSQSQANTSDRSLEDVNTEIKVCHNYHNCHCVSTNNMCSCRNTHPMCDFVITESMCSCKNSNLSSHSNVQCFSDNDQDNCSNVLVASGLPGILATQQVKEDSHGGSVLIGKLTSCRFNSRKIAGRRQTGQTSIDPQDKNQLNVDETLARITNRNYHVSSHHEETLRTRMRAHNSNNVNETNQMHFHHNNIDNTSVVEAHQPNLADFSFCTSVSRNVSPHSCNDCGAGEIANNLASNIYLTGDSKQGLLTINNKQEDYISLNSRNKQTANSSEDSSMSGPRLHNTPVAVTSCNRSEFKAMADGNITDKVAAETCRETRSYVHSAPSKDSNSEFPELAQSQNSEKSSVHLSAEKSSIQNSAEKFRIQKSAEKSGIQSATVRSRHVPRNNVLSLVRYFEKVPYNRNGSKQ